LVSALKKQLSGDGDDVIERAFKDLTAFTHARRIRIVRALNAAPGLSFVALARRTHISSPALRRHLRKLVNRRIAMQREDGSFAVCRGDSVIAKALIRVVCES
jgi:DNA-binding transcriptional ArsR family regulator